MNLTLVVEVGNYRRTQDPQPYAMFPGSGGSCALQLVPPSGNMGLPTSLAATRAATTRRNYRATLQGYPAAAIMRSPISSIAAFNESGLTTCTGNGKAPIREASQ